MASSHADLWWWHPGPERPPPGPQCYVWVQDWKMWNCYACRNSNNVPKTADWTHVTSDKHVERAGEWEERFGLGREHLDMLLGVPAARTAPAPRPPTTTQPPAGSAASSSAGPDEPPPPPPGLPSGPRVEPPPPPAAVPTQAGPTRTNLTTLLGDGRTLRSPAGQPATPAAPQPTTTTTGPSTTSSRVAALEQEVASMRADINRLLALAARVERDIANRNQNGDGSGARA